MSQLQLQLSRLAAHVWIQSWLCEGTSSSGFVSCQTILSMTISSSRTAQATARCCLGIRLPPTQNPPAPPPPKGSYAQQGCHYCFPTFSTSAPIFQWIWTDHDTSASPWFVVDGEKLDFWSAESETPRVYREELTPLQDPPSASTDPSVCHAKPFDSSK